MSRDWACWTTHCALADGKIRVMRHRRASRRGQTVEMWPHVWGGGMSPLDSGWPPPCLSARDPATVPRSFCRDLVVCARRVTGVLSGCLSGLACCVEGRLTQLPERDT
jgi:hypothetical protein